MRTKYLTLGVLLAFASWTAGCAGQDGVDGDMNATDTGRYGMRLHTASDRNNLAEISSDDFLIIDNLVFISDCHRMTDEEIQRNFRGMSVYRVTESEGIQAMDRIQRSLNKVNNIDPSAVAQDIQILLESVRKR